MISSHKHPRLVVHRAVGAESEDVQARQQPPAGPHCELDGAPKAERVVRGPDMAVKARKVNAS
jgi:hypothetical protein